MLVKYLTGSQFTMIDTPGFGDDLENEERTIDELVEVLKNKVTQKGTILPTNRRVSSDGSVVDFGLKGPEFEPRWIL